MLEIIVPAKEFYIDAKNEFINTKETLLQLEHSLISIKKWEAKWHVPYIHTENKTTEQVIDYIKDMTINKGVDPNCYYALTKENVDDITKYIQNPMTATWFSNNKKEGQSNIRKETFTAEVIYYQMIEYGIPVEFQKWHLNQLLTLIRVCQAKRSEANHKASPYENAMKRNAINAKRKAKNRSRG